MICSVASEPSTFMRRHRRKRTRSSWIKGPFGRWDRTSIALCVPARDACGQDAEKKVTFAGGSQLITAPYPHLDNVSEPVGLSGVSLLRHAPLRTPSYRSTICSSVCEAAMDTKPRERILWQLKCKPGPATRSTSECFPPGWCLTCCVGAGFLRGFGTGPETEVPHLSRRTTGSRPGG